MENIMHFTEGKTFVVIQTHLSQVLLCLFQYLCLPTPLHDLNLCPCQTPLMKVVQIPCIPSLSQSYFQLTVPVLLAHGCYHHTTLEAVSSALPNSRNEKQSLFIYFYNTFFSPCLFPQQFFRECF